MKTKFKIKGMNCASCATLLEMDLEDLGYKAKCSYANSELEVETNDKDALKSITEQVEKSGYKIESQ